MRRRAVIAAAALSAAFPAVAVAAPTLAPAPVAPLPWLSADVVPLAWDQEDVGTATAVVVQVNATPMEEKAGASWVTRLVVPAPLASGMVGVVLPVDGLEGTHEVRAVLMGTAAPPLPLGTIRLDRVAPVARDALIEPSVDGSGEVALRWMQSDDLSGTASVVAEVNEGVGADLGSWRPFRTKLEAPWDGPHVATVETAGLADGPHLVRVASVDAAGNASATPVGWLMADHQAPTVEILSAVRTSSDAGTVLAVTYRVADPDGGWGVAPGALATVAGPGGTPTYGQAPGGPGEHVVQVPWSVPQGSQLVVRVADRSGRVGESAPVVPTTGHGPPVGPASVAQDPLERLRGARVIVTAAARQRRPTLVRSIRAGEAITIAGRLVDREGAPLGATDVEVRDAGARPLGTVRTDGDGRFRRSVSPAASGPLAFDVAAQEPLPLQPDMRIVVRVVPRLTVTAAATSVPLGSPVTLRGRFLPAPAALVARGRKTVDLEYRDPLSGEWRSALTTWLAPDGAFSATWTPPAAATLRLRARVRTEIAWPFRDVASRSVPVRVG